MKYMYLLFGSAILLLFNYGSKYGFSYFDLISSGFNKGFSNQRDVRHK